MMSNRRSNNTKRRGGRRFQRRPQLSPSVKDKFNGKVIKRPSFDPPSIVENPWNSLTIAYEANGSASLHAEDIRDTILGTLGLQLAAAAVFDLRVIHARVWETTGTYGIVGEFNNFTYGPSEAPYMPLATVDDNPAKNHWAVIGYDWPSDVQNFVISVGRINPEILVVSTEDQAQVLLHIRCLWKTNVVADTRKSVGKFTARSMKNIQEEDEITSPEE